MDRRLPCWIPPKEITRHSGANIPNDMEFFVVPPVEIGAVLTAESTLNASSQPLSIWTRLLWTAGVSFISTMIASPVLGAFAIVVTLLAGGLTFLSLGFSASCSYVGEQGMAEFFLYDSRASVPESEIFKFSDATQLFTKQTQRLRKGVYQRTQYLYRWVRPGKTDVIISGIFRDQKGWPHDSDRWHFANSAEGVWTRYLLPSINRELEQSGYIEFSMVGKLQAIRVAKGALEFVTQGGETQTMKVEDIKDVALDSGAVQFKHRNAKWFSRQGLYRVAYREMSNAKLFLLCLEQVAGVMLA